MNTATLELTHRAVRIPVAAALLEGEVNVPPRPRGVVVLPHESGKARQDARVHAIAELFNRTGMATVLVDILTPEEERKDALTRELRFDIALLSERVTSIVDWTAREVDIGRLPLGLLSASTGASAALEAAARRPMIVHAVVARSGRPDLADCLDLVRAPVLLIVGGADAAIVELNRQALHHLHGIRQLEIVPSATHHFDEHGAMERAAELAHNWFLRYVAGEPEEW